MTNYYTEMKNNKAGIVKDVTKRLITYQFI